MILPVLGGISGSYKATWIKGFVMRLLLFCLLWNSTLYALPKGFVYLEDIAPGIIQEIRYATHHNFVGRPIAGYEAPRCILTRRAAHRLKAVQEEINEAGFSLKVYDCYRPIRASKDFADWSFDADDTVMKAEFYPNTNKRRFFKLGYVARHSGHNRGSTVDLTLVQLPERAQAKYKPGQRLTACYAPIKERFDDNSIDMGTGFDCFDKRARPSSRAIPKAAYHNRMKLRAVMKKHGFRPYYKEWWHFSLRDEPFPKTYFDFPVR